MNAAQRRIELACDLGERCLKGGPPPNQYVIVAAAEPTAGRKPHDLAQAPPHPVAHHRVANLLRHRETDAHRPILSALARLQEERASGRP
jgi:hypothetical protein